MNEVGTDGFGLTAAILMYQALLGKGFPPTRKIKIFGEARERRISWRL
jgi:hypothetical protein